MLTHTTSVQKLETELRFDIDYEISFWYILKKFFDKMLLAS